MGNNRIRLLLKIFIVVAVLFLADTAKGQEIKTWKLQDLESAIKNADKPTIFNFWATFCKPCIEEMPYFQEVAKKYAADGVELIFISLDLPEAYPARIKNFVTKLKVKTPVVFLDESNADLFCPVVDEKWSGSIPATLFVNHKTGYRMFFEDQLTKKQVEQEIIAMLSLK